MHAGMTFFFVCLFVGMLDLCVCVCLCVWVSKSEFFYIQNTEYWYIPVSFMSFLRQITAFINQYWLLADMSVHPYF